MDTKLKIDAVKIYELARALCAADGWNPEMEMIDPSEQPLKVGPFGLACFPKEHSVCAWMLYRKYAKTCLEQQEIDRIYNPQKKEDAGHVSDTAGAGY